MSGTTIVALAEGRGVHETPRRARGPDGLRAGDGDAAAAPGGARGGAALAGARHRAHRRAPVRDAAPRVRSAPLRRAQGRLAGSDEGPGPGGEGRASRWAAPGAGRSRPERGRSIESRARLDAIRPARDAPGPRPQGSGVTGGPSDGGPSDGGPSDGPGGAGRSGLRTCEGWLALAAVLGPHAPKVGGRARRGSPHAAIALEALDRATGRRRPAPGARGLICPAHRGLGPACEPRPAARPSPRPGSPRP